MPSDGGGRWLFWGAGSKYKWLIISCLCSWEVDYEPEYPPLYPLLGGEHGYFYRLLIILLDIVWWDGYGQRGKQMNFQLSMRNDWYATAGGPPALQFGSGTAAVSARGYSTTRSGRLGQPALPMTGMDAKEVCHSAKRTRIVWYIKQHLSYCDTMGYAMKIADGNSGSFSGITRFMGRCDGACSGGWARLLWRAWIIWHMG